VQTNSAALRDPSNPPSSRASGFKSRHVAELSNIPLLGRTALLSRIQQVATEQTADSQYPRLLAFLQFWRWGLPYLWDFVHKNAIYQTYQGSATGIFKIPTPDSGGPLRIAVAADWGTGTLEALTVGANIAASFPHYTVHLGDVYYMGETGEIEENCLGKNERGYKGVWWPTGSLGSFALMGNHEMYSGGQGYFGDILGKMGLFNADKTVREHQSASYFCLDTDHWLVLGLDTGYHSGGVPIFTPIPGLNNIPALNVDARFDDKMLVWLSQTIKAIQPPDKPKKPILLFTHHQPVSSFERAFTKPTQQLAQMGFLEGQEFVWLYGHEHRLTIYNKVTVANSLQVYPRCIGHGGMPVKVTSLSAPNPNILYYDPRQHPIDKDDPETSVGYNGHVELLFEDNKLVIEYHDIEDNKLLFRESFIPNGTGGLGYLPEKPSKNGLWSGRQV
jgi:hypothetical protein